MKKKIGFLLLFGIILSSCSSDDDGLVENSDGRKLRQLTIAEVPVTRATLTDNNSSLAAAWKANDQTTYFNVTTFSGDRMDWGTLTASSSEVTSTFTGSVYCTTGDNVALFYPHQNVPTQGTNRGKFTVNLAGQDGTLATIAENFHYVYGVAEVTSVTESTANATISNMQSLLAVCKFSFTDGTNDIPVKILAINYYENNDFYPTTIGYPLSATLDPTSDSPTTLTYPAQSAWNKDGLSVTLDSDTSDGVYVALFPYSPTGYMLFTVTNSSGTYTGTAKAKLNAGKYYPVTLKVTK